VLWKISIACANSTRSTGQIDREGNARKVVNCSCVVVRDWGEESQERSILLNYFQTEQ
jgi:small subunit ribosomal protein S12e